MPTPTIVVLGHKDHGKSTFLGRLLFETNSVPVDKVATIKEIDAEADRPFEWAHLLDSFKEEREQEMTYDTASVFVQGKRDTYMFIDVPGHSELVHQMLSGASKADTAILVVSAKEGIDVMSIKHLALAGFLGIKNLIVAINKMDAVGYDQHIFQEMREKVEAEIKNTRFASERVFFIPIAAREGDNLISVSPRMPWFNGANVLERVEENGAASIELPFRGLVQDMYAHQKQLMAMVVVKNGMLNAGMRVKAMPGGIVFPADRLLSSSGQEIFSVGTGENVGIVVEKAWRIGRGTVLSPETSAPIVTVRADAEIFLFQKFVPGGPLFVECGGMRAENAKLFEIKPHEIQSVTLELLEPLMFDSNETFLNKFVLKQEGDIVGVGRIEKIQS